MLSAACHSPSHQKHQFLNNRNNQAYQFKNKLLVTTSDIFVSYQKWGKKLPFERIYTVRTSVLFYTKVAEKPVSTYPISNDDA